MIGIDRCPICLNKLLKTMVFERGFMCDNCGAYAEDLLDEEIKEVNEYIDKARKELKGKQNAER